MDQTKIGALIKELRQKSNLTQKQFAEKYGVTFQAVSKWENGINLPDTLTLKQICNDYNINIDDILAGKINNKNNYYKYILFLILFILLLFVVWYINSNVKRDSFEFKTISSSCEEFNVSGSLAFDTKKTSIYISNINYCGKPDTTIYSKIECNLYEINNNTKVEIQSCESKSNISLESFLRDIKFNIDNYEQSCKIYTEDSLYLEINATNNSNKITTYKIPLNLKENC